MSDERCLHEWKMVDVHYGFVITEKCFHCEKVSTYFAYDQKPPLEEYREGDHFWNVMESAQSIRFSLQCKKCEALYTFNELYGLMMCTGCDDDCEVEILRKDLEPERTWVYVAFGFLPVEERKQLSKEKIAILEEYINQRRKSSTSKVMIVSQDFVSDIRHCYAEVIRDMDMLCLEAPESPAE